MPAFTKKHGRMVHQLWSVDFRLDKKRTRLHSYYSNRATL